MFHDNLFFSVLVACLLFLMFYFYKHKVTVYIREIFLSQLLRFFFFKAKETAMLSVKY
jgi:hypothetical protein